MNVGLVHKFVKQTKSMIMNERVHLVLIKVNGLLERGEALSINPIQRVNRKRTISSQGIFTKLIVLFRLDLYKEQVN